MTTYTEELNKLTSQYNELIRALENSYDLEHAQEGWNLFSSHLSSQYSKKYEVLAREYRNRQQQLFNNYKAKNPEWAKWRKLWGRLFVVGIVLIFGSCIFTLPDDEASDSPVSQAISQTEERYWNAENIPIPYLKDATQYVSNPDYVLAQNTVDSMNVILKRLEDELHVQSVVVVVNHIENDDPFRMAQDLGNKYHVGYHDRGLIVVCGYEDHSINISPGRALEADLTDAECHRLQQQYVIPAMRKEMPDSAMLYLTQAIFSTLQKKELPTMALSSQSDEVDDEVPAILGAYLLALIGWCAFFLSLNRKYQWLGLVGAISLLPNPFYTPSTTSSGGGGGFGGFSGGGGGGFSGGSFGGGSFGGGGATSRW